MGLVQNGENTLGFEKPKSPLIQVRQTPFSITKSIKHVAINEENLTKVPLRLNYIFGVVPCYSTQRTLTTFHFLMKNSHVFCQGQRAHYA